MQNKDKKVLCVIPARGGSKRIPRKNIKNFLGKPIIVYSIEAALQSKIFDEVIVSTDDEEISQIAIENGALVPFYRSSETSNDYAGTADVMFEVLNEYQKIGKEFDVFCTLYPTAPFVTPQRLVEAYASLNDNLDALFTVVKYSYPIQRSLKIDSDGYIRLCFPHYYDSRSQDLQSIYHDAGQFYFVKTPAFYKEHTLWCKRTHPLILNEFEVQDIDSLTDWKLAELKYRLLTEPDIL